MKNSRLRREAIEELSELLTEIHNYVDLVLVEGLRDVESVRALGCIANIEVLSHSGLSDYDLVEMIIDSYKNVLILTDFDEEGLNLNKRFTSLFEHSGFTVENGLRRHIGRIMARIGVYAIEALDNQS